jgi:arginase family enzyme
MSASVVALLCRTSDRTPRAALGAEALAPLVAERLGVEPRLIGTPGEPREGDFADDLRESRGCLLEAGGQVDDALSAGRTPFLLAGDCSVCITTLPTAWRHRPEVRVLWLDAHGDFNTPETTASRFLGGMCLAGACGEWDTGFPETLPPDRVVLAGVRDLDGGERDTLERSGATVIGDTLETLVYVLNALDRSPVYVHLDLDVLDPASFPAQFPAPGGLSPDKLYDVLESVFDECELVGAEITAFEAPEDELERQAAASTALHVVEPLLEAATRGAHVSH